DTTVFFDIDFLHNHKDSIPKGVKVVNTESRSICESEAYEKTYAAATLFKNLGVTHIYKKIDSTLKGNFGTEIKAAANVYKPDFIVIAPAFPDMGRTTIEGIHYINGKPLNKTEVVNDPKTPV